MGDLSILIQTAASVRKKTFLPITSAGLNSRILFLTEVTLQIWQYYLWWNMINVGQETLMYESSFCITWGHLNWGRSMDRHEKPTWHPNGPSTHGCKLPHERWTVPHCTPQLGTCKPSWHPHIQMKGCHVGGGGNLQAWEMARKKPPVPACPLTRRSRRFQINHLRLLQGWFGYGGSGGSSMPLTRRLGHWHRGMRKGIPQEPVQAFCLRSGNCQLPPSGGLHSQRHWASPCNRLAQCNKWSPWKRGERDLSQRLGLAMKQLKNSPERSSNRKQKEIPDLAAPALCLWLKLVHFLPLSRSEPNWSHTVLGWKPQALHPFQMIHLWMRQFQMYKMDLARRPNEQMF